jgi:WXG100 family type VII secretion target
MADLIQAQYEQLDAIAARFGQQAAVAEQISAQVRQAMSSLQQGGWIGQGAAAFFAEMEGLVFPGMGRLSAAMTEGQAATLKIKQIVQEAEEEASSPFRGSNGRTGAPAGAGGGGAGAGAGAGGGSGTAGGAGAGATGGAGGSSAPAGGAPARPGAGSGRAPSPDFSERLYDWLADRPMFGFKLFGVGRGLEGLFSRGFTGWLSAGTKLGPMHALPIVGGILGTTLNILDASARGENMDFAVGREITKGTLKTEVYLIPGVNLVAGGLELAHMFGLTKTNYTNTVVNAVAEPIHKYALDPASDLLAEGMYRADQGIRAGYRGAKSLYNGAVDAFADGLDAVLPDWPW